MEKEELHRQLLFMKREYARKKKKLELAIQSKHSEDSLHGKHVEKQLKKPPDSCDQGDKEFCDKKNQINGFSGNNINQHSVSKDRLKPSLNTCKTETFPNIFADCLEQNTSSTIDEVPFRTKHCAPTNLSQRSERNLQTVKDSECSSVPSNTSKISLKRKNIIQYRHKKVYLSNSVSQSLGESTNKLTPEETGTTLIEQVTISTKAGENADLTPPVNESKLPTPSLKESLQVDHLDPVQTNNPLQDASENHFDSSHISKSDEELVSSEVFCDYQVRSSLNKANSSHNLQSSDNCINNRPALLVKKDVNNDIGSLGVINSPASLCESEQKVSSQCSLSNQNIQTLAQCENTGQIDNLPSEPIKDSDCEEKQVNSTPVIEEPVVKPFRKPPLSSWDFQTFCDLKLIRTEKVPDGNDEVVCLLNTSCCVPIHNDFPVSEDYLVGVTTSSILFWTYTKKEDWHIIYQWKISDHFEECSSASLHPHDSAVCIAVVGLKADMCHSLMLYTFQGLSKRSVSVRVTPVVSLTCNHIIYCSLNNLELAVASMSNNEDLNISKICLMEDFSGVKEEQNLESNFEKLLSLSPIQKLPSGLIGLTVTNVLLIWNHTTNLLLIKVSLTDINKHCCYIPTAMSLEGHIIFPVLFEGGLELGNFVALNPTILTLTKLLSYEKIPHVDISWKPSSVQVFDKMVVSLNENIVGFWDLFSGCLMASIYCCNISCVTIFHSAHQPFWLITSQKGCLHWYS
ncbi:uncharacterized protein LOC115213211 [Argonauta hians]